MVRTAGSSAHSPKKCYCSREKNVVVIFYLLLLDKIINANVPFLTPRFFRLDFLCNRIDTNALHPPEWMLQRFRQLRFRELRLMQLRKERAGTECGASVGSRR